MLKPKSDKISACSIPTYSDDSIRIKAGSFVIDNIWISFNGVIIKIKNYISEIVVGERTRFFKDRNYAVYLLICLDINEGIKIIEGKHVKFTTLKAVPPPESFNSLPLIGLILIQDGTRDLINGFKPISDENIIYFSGMGNILDKDFKGIPGDNSIVSGETGFIGYTGIDGSIGDIGETGNQGEIGITPLSPIGDGGLNGMTGINWNVHVPFDILS